MKKSIATALAFFLIGTQAWSEEKPPVTAVPSSVKAEPVKPTASAGATLPEWKPVVKTPGGDRDSSNEIKAQQAVLEALRGKTIQPRNASESSMCSAAPGGCPSAKYPEAVSSQDSAIGSFHFFDSERSRPSFQSLVQAVETTSAPQAALPEVPTPVKLSSGDNNRITCPNGDVVDTVYSDEKPITVKNMGRDSFIKFKYRRQGGKLRYPTKQVELFVICRDGDSNVTYNLIALPENIPAQTVRLSTGMGDKIKKNQSMFQGMAFEKRLLSLIKTVYTDEIPDSFTVQTHRRPFLNIFRDVQLVLNRTVKAEGEGLVLKEFIVSIKKGSAVDRVEFSEKDFLISQLSQHPAAISLDKTILRRGEHIRLLICEARKDVDSVASNTVIRLDRDYTSSSQKSSDPAPAKKGTESGQANNRLKENLKGIPKTKDSAQKI